VPAVDPSSARADLPPHRPLASSLASSLARGCVVGVDESVARETLPKFELFRRRLSRAAAAATTTTTSAPGARDDRDSDSPAASSIAAATAFASDVSGVLAAAADAAAAASDPRAGVAILQRAVWDLVAVYFLEPGGGTGVATSSLVAWFQRNASCLGLGPGSLPERLRELVGAIGDAAGEGRGAETASGYWECFASLVAVGWNDAAIDLIHLHSTWEAWRVGKIAVKPQAEVMEALIALLRTAPRLGGGWGDDDANGGDDGENGGGASTSTSATATATATSVPQFLAFREGWLRQVRDVLAADDLFDACVDQRTAEGARTALAILAGDDVELDRACDRAGWLEFFVASALRKHPSLRATNGEHASLLSACVARRGAGASAELDALLTAAIEVDAAAVVDACSSHMNAWFLAHVSELLVAAAGDGFVVGVGADARAAGGNGERLALPDARAGAAGSGAVLRRPVRSLLGATHAELYLIEYCAALATRPNTRDLALRYLPHCATRGAGVMSTVLRAAAPPPGAFLDAASASASASASKTARDDAALFIATRDALEACATFGLDGAALGVARSAAAAARANGDQTGAVAWAFRAGDVAAVAALALEQLPTPAQARNDPSAAAATLARLAAEHPAAVDRDDDDDDDERAMTRGGGANANAKDDDDGAIDPPSFRPGVGPAGFLDALAALRADLKSLARAGARAPTPAHAGAIVSGRRARATASRAGGALLSLCSRGCGQTHLWTHAICAAVPLLEGAHSPLSAREIAALIARLEEASAASAADASDVERRARDGASDGALDARTEAARLALARAFARTCASGGGGGGVVA